jgi:hypothetical protein
VKYPGLPGLGAVAGCGLATNKAAVVSLEHMKAREVYKRLREEIGPWARAEGFKRTRTMLSWCRSRGKDCCVFWFQISRDGWDKYAGSKFTVEIQRSPQPHVGEVRAFRERLGAMLDESSREEARKIQNKIIASLPKPPRTHLLADDPWYLEKFDPVLQPYTWQDDLWFRYRSPVHLRWWGQFILKHLPQCTREVEGADSPSTPPPARASRTRPTRGRNRSKAPPGTPKSRLIAGPVPPAGLAGIIKTLLHLADEHGHLTYDDVRDAGTTPKRTRML